MYLCKFDDAGKRIATVVSGIHFSTAAEKATYIKDGYIETSDEDYEFYVGNKGDGANGTGYIRGADGKPADAPAYTPSTEEERASIIAEYNAAKATLTEQYTDAMIHSDTELAEELKAEMLDLDAALDAAIKELEG